MSQSTLISSSQVLFKLRKTSEVYQHCSPITVKRVYAANLFWQVTFYCVNSRLQPAVWTAAVAQRCTNLIRLGNSSLRGWFIRLHGFQIQSPGYCRANTAGYTSLHSRRVFLIVNHWDWQCHLFYPFIQPLVLLLLLPVSAQSFNFGHTIFGTSFAMQEGWVSD